GRAAPGTMIQSCSITISICGARDDAPAPGPGQGSILLAFALQVYYLKLRKEPAMTNGTNRILDEFAKLMTDAAGAAQGVRREVETAFRAQAERILNSMEGVQREGFEAVRDMAVEAREEKARAAGPPDALEAGLAGPGAAD